MAWTPLRNRFESLPFILAGPILRRVTPGSVTVWLAVKASTQVRLSVFAREGAGGLTPLMRGTARTVRIGDHVHVVAVTARAASKEAASLQSGQTYLYDVEMQGEDGKVGGLRSPGILVRDPSSASPVERMVYGDLPLPSFVMPPEALEDLRLYHGSCRKAHATTHENLSTLDRIINLSMATPEERPHLLFMTGDQIYADDVHPALLAALGEAGEFLLAGNKPEVLPLLEKTPREVLPLTRYDRVVKEAGFRGQAKEFSDSHLMGLGEWVAMYLYAWSDHMWGGKDLPAPEQVYGKDVPAELAERYSKGLEHVEHFHARLPYTRRALANVPTYMIFDDHEIADDWYLSGGWSYGALKSPLGNRMIRNGLLSYAMFQAWGNDPDQTDGEAAHSLFGALNAWRGEEGDEHARTIAQRIGVVAPDALGDFAGTGRVPRPAGALQWHYTVEGPGFQVLVLDCRTWRTYRGPDESPGLIDPAVMPEMLPRRKAQVTFIVSPTPVFGINLFQLYKQAQMIIKGAEALHEYDAEAWAFDPSTFVAFLKHVSWYERVVILSGDLHFGYATSANVKARRSEGIRKARLLNFVSTPLRNDAPAQMHFLHKYGYPYLSRALQRGQAVVGTWLGWIGFTADWEKVASAVRELATSEVKPTTWWDPRTVMRALDAGEGAVVPVQGLPEELLLGLDADARFDLTYLVDTRWDSDEHDAPTKDPRTRNPAMKKIDERMRAMRQEKRGTWPPGTDVVTPSHIGEVRFVKHRGRRWAVQRLWWVHPEQPDAAAPYTQYMDKI